MKVASTDFIVKIESFIANEIRRKTCDRLRTLDGSQKISLCCAVKGRIDQYQRSKLLQTFLVLGISERSSEIVRLMETS